MASCHTIRVAWKLICTLALCNCGSVQSIGQKTYRFDGIHRSFKILGSVGLRVPHWIHMSCVSAIMIRVKSYFKRWMRLFGIPSKGGRQHLKTNPQHSIQHKSSDFRSAIVAHHLRLTLNDNCVDCIRDSGWTPFPEITEAWAQAHSENWTTRRCVQLTGV